MTELVVGLGDRVATLSKNNNGFLEFYCALACMGATCQTINLGLHLDQIVFVINDAEVIHFVLRYDFCAADGCCLGPQP